MLIFQYIINCSPKLSIFVYSIVTYKDNQKNVATSGNEVFQPLNTIISDILL